MKLVIREPPGRSAVKGCCVWWWESWMLVVWWEAFVRCVPWFDGKLAVEKFGVERKDKFFSIISVFPSVDIWIQVQATSSCL